MKEPAPGPPLPFAGYKNEEVHDDSILNQILQSLNKTDTSCLNTDLPLSERMRNLFKQLPFNIFKVPQVGQPTAKPFYEELASFIESSSVTQINLGVI